MDKTLVFDGGTGSCGCSPLEAMALGSGGFGMNGMLPAMAMMNGGCGGYGGMNNPIWAIIVLAFLRQLGYDGNGGYGAGCNCLTQNQLSAIQETLNTNQGNTLLMNAITSNGGGIKELSTALNCNHNAVTAAINAVQSAICSVGNQVGMTSAQVINAIQNGNMQLANTLQSCCCDVKNSITTQGYESRIATLNQTNQLDRAIAGVDNTVIKGFCDTAYATQQQTNALAQNNDANTRAILAKLDQIEDSRKDREINALTAQVATLTSRAERQSELAPINKALADIQCRQVSTITVPNPSAVAVPACVAYNAGLYGAGQFGLNGAGIFG